MWCNTHNVNILDITHIRNIFFRKNVPDVLRWAEAGLRPRSGEKKDRIVIVSRIIIVSVRVEYTCPPPLAYKNTDLLCIIVFGTAKELVSCRKEALG